MADKGRYRKIYMQFWLDTDVRALSEYEQLIAIYCMTGPQSNRIGLFTFSLSLGAEQFNGTNDNAEPKLNRFRNGFRTVCDRLGWAYDDSARVLYIPSWWKWNAPDNAKVMKGSLKDLNEIAETPLLSDFSANTQYLHGTVLDAFLERFPEPLRMGMAFQEQEQEQEQEQDLKTRSEEPLVAEPEPEPAKPKRTPAVPVTLDAIEYPEGMDTPEVRETLERWLKYKRLRREAYKAPDSVSLLLRQFAKTYGRDGPREFVEGVKRAMANNWAGCFFGGKDAHGNAKKDERLEAAHTRGQRRVFD